MSNEARPKRSYSAIAAAVDSLPPSDVTNGGLIAFEFDDKPLGLPLVFGQEINAADVAGVFVPGLVIARLFVKIRSNSGP